jgi:hypothetical protein
MRQLYCALCACLSLCLSPLAWSQEPALPATGADELIRNVEQQRQVVEQFLTGRVQDALAKSRTDMRTNPQGAIELLKQAQQAVLSTPEISADVRQQLRNQLENALRQAANVQTIREVEDVAQRRVQAESEERKRLVEGLRQKDEKLKAILSRFEFLMDERQYRAAEDLANLARQESPGTFAAASGSENANLRGNFIEFMAIREQRHRNYAAALLSSERSSIPFPDEPPLVYPDPEVWARLTERRKQYAAVDLADQGPAEKRIRSALDNPARMEFIETPLNDVIEFLKDEHEVPIQLDKKALEDEGLDSASPITMNLAGVSFRSAMRLMLDPLGLTYVIKNEVMLVTTKVKAEEDLITKVYPVADLVVPIETPPTGSIGLNGAVGGGGQFGAGGGANGGGMGGMGGGGGMGMGGGMGGMGGGGGGGGGFF